MTLAAFHAAASRFYEGQDSPAHFVASLGGSPSATSRFTYYQRLVEADVLRILGHLFPCTRALMGGANSPAWVDRVRRYRVTHPCAHWDLNQWGAAFAGFVMADAGSPPGAWELADHEWTRFTVNTHPSDWDGITGVNPTVQVVQYTRLVSDCIARFRLHPNAAPPLIAGDVSLLIWRAPVTDQLCVSQPSLAMLLELARARGEVDDTFVARTALSAEQRAEARRTLEDLGLLGHVMVPA